MAAITRGQLGHLACGSKTVTVPARPVVRCSSQRESATNVKLSDAVGKKCRSVAAVAAAAIVLASMPGPSHAAVQKVGEFSASGFLFKDNVELTALDDPEVAGVTVYVSDFKRSIVDKLAKDFFSEPSQASISCALTGPVSFRQGSADALAGAEGAEMFSEGRGFNLFKNKTLRIRRNYDATRNVLVYTAYSTRLSTAADDGQVSSGRYRTSLCAVKLPDPIPAVPVGDASNN